MEKQFRTVLYGYEWLKFPLEWKANANNCCFIATPAYMKTEEDTEE